MRPLIACALLAAIACSDSTDNKAPAAVRTWLDSSSAPLTSLEPIPTTADLAPLGALVGNARLIGFGEDTHGTHEFFTMKNRAFQYLVAQKGVTAFAIEATMPEAFALDTYVRTGKGDPRILLSHLYFWTWNTQEVADLIAWLRQWNVDHPGAQVGFYGFDMQFPGVAIDSVLSLAPRFSADAMDTLATHYACLIPYRNDTKGRFTNLYSSAPTQTQQRCSPEIVAARAYLDAHQADFTAATSARDFALARQMAHIVEQWESYSRGVTSRDLAMAENIGWLLQREGASGKLFLWAHNGHISRQTGTMGGALATQRGADYLPIGFAFGSGGFNAVELLSGGGFGFLRLFTSPTPPSDSYEATLLTAPHSNFLLDLRDAPADVRSWFLAQRHMRSIGAAYGPTQDGAFYFNQKVAAEFDGLIFVRTTTASTLLQFVY